MIQGLVELKDAIDGDHRLLEKKIDMLGTAVAVLTGIVENIADVTETNQNKLEEQDSRINALEERAASCTADPGESSEGSSSPSLQGGSWRTS